MQYPILSAVALVLKYRVPQVYELFRRGEKTDEEVVDALFAEPVSGCVKARINGEQRSPLPAVCGAGDDSERWVGV